MNNFTPFALLAGGVLIGLSATAMRLFNGTIVGISGILAGALRPVKSDTSWRLSFLGGLMAGGLILRVVLPQSSRFYMKSLVSFISGVVFALGLGISGMTRPVKVIGFLDFTGHWDPSLAFVMIGAITVYFVAYRLIRTCSEPVQTTKFSVSQRADIDPNLVVGAAVFGAGWGLGGFCPGPALASLASGAAPVVIFVAAMATGMYLQGMIARPNWWRIFARQPALAALRPLGDDS